MIVHGNQIIKDHPSVNRAPWTELSPNIAKAEGLDYAEGPSICFMVASGGVISEGYERGGPGVCLGDSQTEAERVPSLVGRGDALLRS